jgi:hypothetical protein
MSIDDYVVEWSPHQKQFHVETVKQMLKCNARIFARQSLGDYVVLSFEKDREAAHATIKELRKIIEKDTPANEDESA